MCNSFDRSRVAARIFTPNISRFFVEQLRCVMDKRSDIEFEFCILALPVSNPAVADFGFSITIVLRGRTGHETDICHICITAPPILTKFAAYPLCMKRRSHVK